MIENELLEEIKRIRAIANTGLLYTNDAYDKERYLELEQITLRLLTTTSGHSMDNLRRSFPLVGDYPTAKVDIRAVVLSPDKKILLVQERSDNKWSLPGGWADIGYSAKENIIKECKEETGLDVVVKKLVAVFDKRKHSHPSDLLYVYKMVFYCEAVTSELSRGFDVMDVQYFSIDGLPALSENRVLKSQVEMVYKKIMKGDSETFFD